MPAALAFGCLAITPVPWPWMNPSIPPAKRAALLVGYMNLSEKVHLFHGSGSGYVGNVEGNSRLGIPAIRMNDGPQGFRDNVHPGSSTAWPCSLAIGATFDRAAAYAWGAAMGDEFFRKGSNVQLGPGMCIARVPRNGRNFEYISGEDPYLGYVLVQPVVTGIQAQGVVANAKVGAPSPPMHRRDPLRRGLKPTFTWAPAPCARCTGLGCFDPLRDVPLVAAYPCARRSRCRVVEHA